jgi:hypothetical protein
MQVAAVVGKVALPRLRPLYHHPVPRIFTVVSISPSCVLLRLPGGLRNRPVPISAAPAGGGASGTSSM